MVADPKDDAAGATRDSKAEVLDAAARAFMSSGFASTTLNDIADLLGSTKGRVYHYYRSKGAIFLDVIRTAMHVLIERVGPITRSDLPADEKLEAMAREHALITMEYFPYFRVTTIGVLDIQSRQMAGVTGTLPSDIIKLRDEYESYFVDVITDGVADGLFRRVRPRLASKEVLGALNWIVIWYAAGGRGDAPEMIAQEFASFVTRGLLKFEAAQ